MRGGKRAGAGRPAGSSNADTAAARQALASLMGDHVTVAIAALSEIAARGTSESARVSAACAILDRTHGRPAQAVSHDGHVDDTVNITRVIIQAAVPDDLREALDTIGERLSDQTP
jgi:hypothetical protein